MAVNDIDWRVRSAAVRNLTDQALLRKIAVNDSHTIVRHAAEARLNALRSAPPK